MTRKMAVVLSLLGLILLAAPTLSTRADEGEGDETLEHKGIIASRPAGVAGEWIVGEKTFLAGATTHVEENHGPLEVGVCAAVKFVVDGETNVAVEIESHEPGSCGEGDEDDHMEIYGIVAELPDGLLGEWVIGDAVYVANENTAFSEKDGPFAVGVCVEVVFAVGSQVALEIETEDMYKCTGESDDDDEPEPYSHVKGILESFPDGLIGSWVVAGETFTATEDTHFEQEAGPFFLGGCVEVKFVAATHTAVEIETEDADDCGDGAEHKVVGFIVSIPDGGLGPWVIGDLEVLATESTEFEEEHGPLEVGACAEVEYVVGDAGKIADKIESQEPFECHEGAYTNELLGFVDERPDMLFGTWVVDGVMVEATPFTEFETEHGPLVVGACVKVEYFSEGGLHWAVEIESKPTAVCNGEPESGPAKLYATLDAFPAEPHLGLWTIGSVDFEAVAMTEFETEHGPFEVGGCVKARYAVVAGANVLIEVETKEPAKCLEDGVPAFKAFGRVESLPDGPAYVGPWVVSNIGYEATAATEIEAEHGALAAGAYVKVVFVVDGGARLAKEIKTHVAPGAGQSTDHGRLNDHDATDDWSDWVVDGVAFPADQAVEVVAGDNVPAVGDYVFLNTYQVNGVTFVTQATGAYNVALPALFRK